MKHRYPFRDELLSLGFPLGKTGGLIEAPRAGVVVDQPRQRFRWVKPAASLKPEVLGTHRDIAYEVSAG